MRRITSKSVRNIRREICLGLESDESEDKLAVLSDLFIKKYYI